MPLKTNLVAKVGDGNHVMFWADSWVGIGPLKDRFPDMYAIAKNKRSLVKDCVFRLGSEIRWAWDWLRGPNNTAEWASFADLFKELDGVEICGGEDVWKWRPESDGRYVVANVRDQIMKMSNEAEEDQWGCWNRWVPQKINYFCWRATRNKIACKVELGKRGVPIHDMECARCGEQHEDVKHLMINCPIAKGIWWTILVWLKLPANIDFNNCEEALNVADNYIGSKSWKKVIGMICMVTMWQIWKARNEKVFQGTNVSIIRTVEDIKANLFLWLKERSKFKDINWERWCDFNVSDVIV
ncbi:putative reverse transcriptase zinc-binding domain-containing protein [Helianthus anomalus]